jgi:acyl carrier protein
VSQLAARLGVPAAEIDPDLPVEAYPVTSLAAVSMIAELSQWLNWQVTPSVLVEYPTLSAIAEQLASEIPVLSDGPVTEAEPAPVPEPRSVLSRIRRVFR